MKSFAIYSTALLVLASAGCAGIRDRQDQPLAQPAVESGAVPMDTTKEDSRLSPAVDSAPTIEKVGFRVEGTEAPSANHENTSQDAGQNIARVGEMQLQPVRIAASVVGDDSDVNLPAPTGELDRFPI